MLRERAYFREKAQKFLHLLCIYCSLALVAVVEQHIHILALPSHLLNLGQPMVKFLIII